MRAIREARTAVLGRQLLALALAGVITTGLAVSPAGGQSLGTVPLPLHGTIGLTGSKIRCGSGTLKGLTYVDCGVASASGQPKRGGYVALIAADGRVNIVSTTTLKTEFSRKPAGVVRETAVTPVRPGDTIEVPGTSILCSASSVQGKPTIFCDYVDKKGSIRPGSYSFGISDVVVTALGWDAVRHAHVISSWPENG